ncbi:hypothetical protein T265_02157 [Opisthorchis viverrini]|uniref:Uncharacterized protein n=1 Tax=Opisthorchis viverrini TaxID=6198 RepID=A0A074ZX58_OPIVI|nr:hypothetical protein T265_02157 [Opisthorchis viverrini]KER31651.1 hypothetical protein T265_02157 [Opisthorchis viverrini]
MLLDRPLTIYTRDRTQTRSCKHGQTLRIVTEQRAVHTVSRSSSMELDGDGGGMIRARRTTRPTRPLLRLASLNSVDQTKESGGLRGRVQKMSQLVVFEETSAQAAQCTTTTTTTTIIQARRWRDDRKTGAKSASVQANIYARVRTHDNSHHHQTYEQFRRHPITHVHTYKLATGYGGALGYAVNRFGDYGPTRLVDGRHAAHGESPLGYHMRNVTKKQVTSKHPSIHPSTDVRTQGGRLSPVLAQPWGKDGGSWCGVFSHYGVDKLYDTLCSLGKDAPHRLINSLAPPH